MMITEPERGLLREMALAVSLTPVGELPLDLRADPFTCPVCHNDLVPDRFSPTYEEAEKIRTWTMAQLVAFEQLQRRSGIGFRELLARTSGGQGEYVGVSDFHGMYVGIEPDGYTHS